MGGVDRDGHHDNRGESRASKIHLRVVCLVYVENALMNPRSSVGATSPTPLHPHPSQVPPAAHVGGANHQKSGRYRGHQGQHGTGHHSVIQADGGGQPAILGGDGK